MRFIGWIFSLLILIVFILFYNLRYNPLHNELIKIKQENLLWQSQIKELEGKLARLSTTKEPIFKQTYLWDELFAGPASFSLTQPAQVMLKEIVPRLQELEGEIIIAGHCDNTAIPPELQSKYNSVRELSFAKALAVLNCLESWGIAKERLVCIGYGNIRPIADDNLETGRVQNRRIEIIVNPF
ncbi:MAG: OmpA family protein [candidate division WOR-3 bacterium]|nr:OmpA family protein [candidate division WOR-3 bacterium]